MPSVRGGLQLALQILLSAALFAVIEVQAHRHNVRFDLSPMQAFVLSPEAKQVAAAAPRAVRVTVFYESQQDGRRRAMFDLLEQFQAADPQFTFRMFDLDRTPGMAKKYGVSSYNSGVLESNGKAVVLPAVNEEAVTGALLKVSDTRRRVLCFVTGHGERNPANTDDREGYSQVAKALERENFTIETMGTIAGGIPPRCTVLVLAGPSHDLLPGEADVLTSHLQAGGKALLMADPDAPASVRDLLQRYGVEPENDLIVDEHNRLIGWDSFVPHVPIFNQRTFGGKLTAEAVFSLARTVRPAKKPPEGIRVTGLALSSSDSWARTGGGAVPDGEVHFRKEMDRPGPLPVGVMVEWKEKAGATAAPDSRSGRVVLFGDSDFATNFYLNLLGNKDLFMSTIAVLAESPELIAVRRKGRVRGPISPIVLTASDQRWIFWVGVVIQPALFLLAGIIVSAARRRRRGGR